jgi:hypothetical protein
MAFLGGKIGTIGSGSIRSIFYIVLLRIKKSDTGFENSYSWDTILQISI